MRSRRLDHGSRYGGIDGVKLLAALLVVAIHTGPLLSFDAYAEFLLTGVIGRLAVPFFFMASGFLFFRKLTGARLMMPGSDRGRGSRQPRLGIVDVYDLDRQRQLLLLRRDNVEHLLLIGGPNDVVIETNIVRVAGARIPAPSNDTGVERFEPTLDQPGRPPQVEPNGRPSIESQLAAQLGAFVRRPSEESDIDQELAPIATASARSASFMPKPVAAERTSGFRRAVVRSTAAFSASASGDTASALLSATSSGFSPRPWP